MFRCSAACHACFVVYNVKWRVVRQLTRVRRVVGLLSWYGRSRRKTSQHHTAFCSLVCGKCLKKNSNSDALEGAPSHVYFRTRSDETDGAHYQYRCRYQRVRYRLTRMETACRPRTGGSMGASGRRIAFIFVTQTRPHGCREARGHSPTLYISLCFMLDLAPGAILSCAGH